MARKIETDKVKKKGKKKKIAIALLVIAIIGLLVFIGIKIIPGNDKGTQTVVKVLSSLDEYGYTLTDQDGEYYKKEFKKLEEILRANPIDEKAYNEQVAKMFVIDLYTMSTKLNKYDIGGYEFYYRDKVDMFSQKVMDTLYSQMEDNMYGDRKQELPEIKEVTVVSVEESQYMLKDGTVPAYQVKLNMTYVKDMGYDTKGTVMLCKEDGVRWSVVDYQATLDPEYD